MSKRQSHVKSGREFCLREYTWGEALEYFIQKGLIDQDQLKFDRADCQKDELPLELSFREFVYKKKKSFKYSNCLTEE